MPNGERDFLTARQMELMEKSAHYDALLMLDKQAAQVERLAKLFAGHYQNQFHIEIADQAIKEFEQVEHTLKVGTVMLIGTVLTLGISSAAIAAGSGQMFRTGTFYWMSGEAAIGASGAPVVMLGGELTVAQKVMWILSSCGNTFGISCSAQLVITNDTFFGLVCRRLGNENISRESAADQWIGLAVMAHIRSLSSPLNYLLGMNESQIGEVRQKVEEHVGAELQKHFAGNANATAEAIRRMRDTVLIEFWADRANEATQFRIQAGQAIGMLRNEINKLKAEVERAVRSIGEKMLQPSYM